MSTGEERTAVSNDQGNFLISYLKPSTYTIKTEKSGFGTIEYTAMTLAVGQELALDFELKPAGVQDGDGSRTGPGHQFGAKSA